jgi:hypothetical protein
VWKLIAWPIAPATRSRVRPRSRRPTISAAWTVWKYPKNASRESSWARVRCRGSRCQASLRSPHLATRPQRAAGRSGCPASLALGSDTSGPSVRVGARLRVGYTRSIAERRHDVASLAAVTGRGGSLCICSVSVTSDLIPVARIRSVRKS